MIMAIKTQAEMNEGPEAFQRFRGAMAKALTVSHDEVKLRVEAERKKSLDNPNRRGPKRKAKT
jgi:hypothetical protein